MKVLILVSSIIPNGGTERAISNLTRLLSGISDLECLIISVSSRADDCPAFTFHCPILHLGKESLRSSLLDKLSWYFKLIPSLKRIIKEKQPDVIVGIGHNMSIMLPLIAPNGTRTYACEHINFHTIPIFNRLLIRCIYPKLTGIVVLSKLAQSKLKRFNSNIQIIPNSVSFTPVHVSNLQNQSMIMVGRISAEKGYDRIPDIALILKKELPDWHINIFGDGPERKKIEDNCESLGLSDYVTFHGTVNNIQNQYSENSILLLTSYTEALPMSIIEANACGLPVVAYENEGVNALISSTINGYVVPSNNSREFANKVVEIAINQELRRTLSNNALHLSELFSDSTIRAKWEILLLGTKL